MKKFLSLFALALSLIGGNVAAQSLATVAPEVIRYGTGWVSTAGNAANTAQTVFTAGSNTKGALVWQCSAYNRSNGTTATNPLMAFIASATAPTSLGAGTTLSELKFANSNTGGQTVIHLPRAIFVPAGQGLFYISIAADDSFTHRSCLYTLIP